ncbi:reverse transcriptase [Abeliophyllum distichum]|uniref:Reverse transcriptase n=1 Tax=Abeliophyllum distichum TaxID=126358 RepID=A0ABD1UNL1_9LAMI
MLECYEDVDDENFPFTNYMKAMKVSANFRMPLMDKYNGRGYPTYHINIYKTKLQGQSPAVMCRNFHTTLTSDAKRWYNELKLRNIKMKSYFKRFSNVINKIETVTDDKALDALVTELHLRTPFWRDVQNSQPKTYSQLVDLIQCKIRSEETIENKKRAEKDKRTAIEGRDDAIQNPSSTVFRESAPQR